MRGSGYVFCAVLCLILSTTLQAAEKGSVVKLIQKGDSWQLLRNGKPYFVKGAGGSDRLELLKECGGNSIRTWGTGADTQEILDRAHKNGISVTLGLWMGHKRHGFNYNDKARVQKQFETHMAAVRKYKDHPAVLAWGVGNEMEIQQDTNITMWKAVNAVAKEIKKIDPNHPTVTVLADLGADCIKVKMIDTHCPDIDIIGINSYGGLFTVAERFRSSGTKRPFLLTEYTPMKSGKEAWGVHREANTTLKSDQYEEIYNKVILGNPDICLGGYLFVWGRKTEITETFFGVFLDSGEILQPVERFRKLFKGKPAKNRCPRIKKFSLGKIQLSPGETATAEVSATDPDGDNLRYVWQLRDEVRRTMGGDHTDKSKTLDRAVKGEGNRCALTAPAQGKYRLYVMIYDDKGNAATANQAILISPKRAKVVLSNAKLPLYIYRDKGTKSGYAASGRMGDNSAVQVDEACTDNPKSGAHCMKVSFNKKGGWAGCLWQNPPNDWGSKKGGQDLTGAKKLLFWARGAEGGEKIKFGYGSIGPDKPFHDSSKQEKEFTLTKDWKLLSFDLSGKDMSTIKTPFMWVLGGQGKPIAFFLDDVRYE